MIITNVLFQPPALQPRIVGGRPRSPRRRRPAAILSCLLAVVLATSAAPGARGNAVMAADDGGTDLEQSLCGRIREPFAFWSFRRVAGRPDASRLAGIRDIEPISFLTRDDRTLRGYKLRAERPWGYLLVAQGNAMLADQVIGEFATFRDLGLDVYLYDYRGYGLSNGKSRLKAIVADYRALVAHLDTQGYRRRLVYGLSMGGVMLLNAVGSSADYDAAVIDSSPGRITPFGCPEACDPVRHLPRNGARLMIILGDRDTVVPAADVEELASAARSRGATVLHDAEFAHPFMDASYETHRRRFRAIAEFLARFRP
ncbi:MAG: hypothetical protein NFCOHLIN_00239 [Gammaproteobacteria bacterium]|nr:hypothetical protein [Gammaproteobacteria bacterium]